MPADSWATVFDKLPLIAILRGVTPDECVSVAACLFDEGIEILEIPLNSPDPLTSIGYLTNRFPERYIGAGTVLTGSQVERCQSVGCKLVVAPNIDPEVARLAKAAGMIYCPGVATPSEAFSALKLGADALKFFPGELITPNVIKAMRAVLPADSRVVPVGGVSVDNMADYLAVGANGFGIGSALYKPGKSITEIRQSARAFVDAFRSLR